MIGRDTLAWLRRRVLVVKSREGPTCLLILANFGGVNAFALVVLVYWSAYCLIILIRHAMHLFSARSDVQPILATWSAQLSRVTQWCGDVKFCGATVEISRTSADSAAELDASQDGASEQQACSKSARLLHVVWSFAFVRNNHSGGRRLVLASRCHHVYRHSPSSHNPLSCLIRESFAVKLPCRVVCRRSSIGHEIHR